MPVPGHAVDRDLTELYLFEKAEQRQTGNQGKDADQQMGGVDAGDDVEEVDGRGGPAIEGVSLDRQLSPGSDLTGDEEAAQDQRYGQPR